MNISQRSGVRQYNKSEHPRLRWTPELHQHFVEAVERLGGKYKATPKRILQMMSVKELKIAQVKSHLQMYRSMKDHKKIDVLKPMKHLRAKGAQIDDIGIFSIWSSQRLQECFRGAECERWTSKYAILSDEVSGLVLTEEEDGDSDQQDSSTSFLGTSSRKEDTGGLTGICKPSLSLTPSLMMQNEEERNLYPLADHQVHQFSSADNLNNVEKFHCLETNHINLDLTI